MLFTFCTLALINVSKTENYYSEQKVVKKKTTNKKKHLIMVSKLCEYCELHLPEFQSCRLGFYARNIVESQAVTFSCDICFCFPTTFRPFPEDTTYDALGLGVTQQRTALGGL